MSVAADTISNPFLKPDDIMYNEPGTKEAVEKWTKNKETLKKVLPEAIKAVAENCPEVCVGAGTILNLEQAKLAIEMGAKFIVSPGYSEEVVSWCVENNIPVAPGCVTPTEIMAALSHGLKMIKFFPANVYGGLNAMKNLSAPFVGVKFLPTGGVNASNIKESIDAPFIHAVGGSWVCPKADINAGNWDKITALCVEARKNAKGE